MKTPGRSQNTNRRALARLRKPGAALWGGMALFVPREMWSAAAVEYDITITRQEVNGAGLGALL
jgi:hypothetical protein